MTSGVEELGHEVVPAHLDSELEPREPWLGDYELGRTDPEAVADTDVGVNDAFGSQVLAECAGAEVELRPLARPELVELRRVGVHSLVRTSVHAQVRPAGRRRS